MSRNVTYAPTGNRGIVISARTRSDLDSRLRDHGPATVIIFPPKLTGGRRWDAIVRVSK